MITTAIGSKLQGVWHSRSLFFSVLMLQFLFLVLLVFDIPTARQTLGFVYLSFVPGLVFLKLLRFRNLGLLELILFSVGFSVAFLMFAGLLVNELGPALGVLSPLTEVPLAIALNAIVLLFSLPSSRRSFNLRSHLSEIVGLIKKAPLALPFLCLPLLSVIGSFWNNAYGDNTILLILLATIAVLFTLGCISRRLLPWELYPFAVLMIAVSLLLHRALFTSFLQSQGSDIYQEISMFNVTRSNAFWNSAPPLATTLLSESSRLFFSRYNNMLSITVLPTVFSSLMNYDSTWTMKLLYPLLFSLVPLTVYCISQKQLGPRIGFVATFLFMAEQTFYWEMVSLARQMIAELFFGLLLIVVLNKKIAPVHKIACFIVFGMGLIVSHYATALILLFFLLAAFIPSFIMKRLRTTSTEIVLTVLFSVQMFLWYIYTSGAATFDSMREFGGYVVGQLGEFSNPSSRGSAVLTGLGLAESPHILNSISRGFLICVELLIVLGFVSLILYRSKKRMDQEYLKFIFPAILLLAALLLVPGLANTLNMSRFFHILLFFLAPLSVLGAELIAKPEFMRKMKIEGLVLVVVVLVPYFLFQTNLVFEVAQIDSWSLPLSAYRMSTYSIGIQRLYTKYEYVDAASIHGSQWLLINTVPQDTLIYGDYEALGGSFAYCGGYVKHSVMTLSNVTIVDSNGVVYLDRFNTVIGNITGVYRGKATQWKTSELAYLNDLDQVYSNGASKIYRKP